MLFDPAEENVQSMQNSCFPQDGNIGAFFKTFVL